MVTVADLAWKGYNASCEDLIEIWEVAGIQKVEKDT